MNIIKFWSPTGGVDKFTGEETSSIPVRLTDGRFQYVRCLGFIPAGPDLKPDGYRRFVKIAAISVFSGEAWRILQADEFIVGWLVPFNATHPGIKVVVDAEGLALIRRSA